MLSTSLRATDRPKHVSTVLHPVAPFSLNFSAWAIQRRPNNLVDRWDGVTYGRVIMVADRPVRVDVIAAGTTAHPILHVTADGASLTRSTRAAVTATLDRILGLQLDLRPFYRLANRDPLLALLAARFRGLKPPRFPTVFEAVVNGIACQQLSLTVGIILLDRLAQRCAPSVAVGATVVYAFPRPRDIAGLRSSDLRALGFSEAKARALLELATSVEDGLALESLTELDDETAIAKLLALRGVGRWTAEYVLLRGLGRINLFPGDDVGARTNLARWMKLRTPLDYDRVRRLARRWHPFAGFLYFHLLLKRLEETGQLGDDS